MRKFKIPEVALWGMATALIIVFTIGFVSYTKVEPLAWRTTNVETLPTASDMAVAVDVDSLTMDLLEGAQAHAQLLEAQIQGDRAMIDSLQNDICMLTKLNYALRLQGAAYQKWIRQQGILGAPNTMQIVDFKECD